VQHLRTTWALSLLVLMSFICQLEGAEVIQLPSDMARRPAGWESRTIPFKAGAVTIDEVDGGVKIGTLVGKDAQETYEGKKGGAGTLKGPPAVDIAQAVLFGQLVRCGTKTVKVLLSTDGSNWTKAYSHDGSTFKVLTVGLAGQKARYVKMQLIERKYLHFQEGEVYGY